jgi:hypothetical protein
MPMGTNCAPVLANIFLYTFEAKFIDWLGIHNPTQARDFHMTFRYIDDVLSVDNPHWTRYIQDHGIDRVYPKELVLNDTTVSNERVNFLGMEIEGCGNRFCLRIFDKRKTFPFTVRLYPQMSSLLPRTIPYGVFLGQLHRGYRICTEWRDFLTFAVELANRLLANGCNRSRLEELFRRFPRRHVRKYESVSRSLLLTQFRRSLGNSL